MNLLVIKFCSSPFPGKVLNEEVMTSYCPACIQWEHKKNSNDQNDEYGAWLASHLPISERRYQGSAYQMEVEGAVRIFF